MHHIRVDVFGMKMQPFADTANVSVSTVSRWEAGTAVPNLCDLWRIRQYAFDNSLGLWSDAMIFDRKGT